MILIMGHIKFAPGKFEAARPHMRTMIEATRKEAGCLLYVFAEDAIEPGILRICERWESDAALKAHVATPHMAAWRGALKEIGYLERDVRTYEGSGERAL